MSLHVLMNNDVSRKCHLWLMLSMMLKEASSLNDVNNDTCKSTIFKHFLKKINFYKITNLDTYKIVIFDFLFFFQFYQWHF